MGRLALVVALVALALAWLAYLRTGGSLETLVNQPWRAGSTEAEAPAGWRARLAEARERLLENRGEVQAERNLDQVREDIESIRRDLRASFDGASETTLERWRQVDAELEQLQRQVRDGSNQAVQTLDSVADRLRSWTQDRER
ncbi:MAG TPA: hypothetical protein VHN15_04585 [Thermoanaerobaculia bacterium]|nr:hypothetical protein [Thermoanaerobaculia bacterium]